MPTIGDMCCFKQHQKAPKVGRFSHSITTTIIIILLPTIGDYMWCQKRTADAWRDPSRYGEKMPIALAVHT